MNLQQPNQLPSETTRGTKKKYSKLIRLINELNKHELSSECSSEINGVINMYNSFDGPVSKIGRTINKTRSRILGIAEKRMKLIPKNAMMVRWMGIGMSAFGVPLGLVYGLSIGNMAFLGVGLSIGLSIGLAIGAGLDNKAKKDNRQLDIEL